jgi:hypothetical protein
MINLFKKKKFKVRLQTMPAALPGQAPIYAGTLDCAKKTIAHEVRKIHSPHNYTVKLVVDFHEKN